MVDSVVRLPLIHDDAVPLHGDHGPEIGDIQKCVRCGFCLNFCPTFVELGVETESPRGRIALIKALTQGRASLTDNVIGHLDLCLQCRACETACPSGVPFGKIMEEARSAVLQHSDRAPATWKLRSLLLRQLLPYPKRLELLLRLLRLYQRSGVQRLVRLSGITRLLPARLRHADDLLPVVPERFFRATGVIARPQDGQVRRRVAILSGCIMPLVYGRVNEATVRVLARNGCEVVVPPAQVCCGALLLHNGDAQATERLARHNIRAFLDAGVDAVIVNSAGCGSTLKEYGQILRNDSKWAATAKRFSSMVKDISEFLAELPDIDRRLGPLPMRVTYQDSCHLVHAQRVREQPRNLMRAIPRLELVEMENADRCCGSAGIYNITQQEMSLRLLRNKMASVAATQPQVIVTANPGCMLQLEAGCRLHNVRAEVRHVVELLDEAYQRYDERTDRP